MMLLDDEIMNIIGNPSCRHTSPSPSPSSSSNPYGDKLLNEVTLLRTKNKELECQLESLKENTIVESMNDMKDSYREVIKENVELREKLSLLQESNLQVKLSALKRKVVIYGKIINLMRKCGRELVSTNKIIEKTIRQLVDTEGEIVVHEMIIDGIFSVSQTANEDFSDCIENDFKEYLKCAKDECNNCYRCCYEDDDTDILECF